MVVVSAEREREEVQRWRPSSVEQASRDRSAGRRLAEEHLDFFLSCVLHAPKRADVDEQA